MFVKKQLNLGFFRLLVRNVWLIQIDSLYLRSKQNKASLFTFSFIPQFIII
jgi:hypothetical protein